jgi:hypothetical protein
VSHQRKYNESRKLSKKFKKSLGLELIFVAIKSKISRSILKIIAGWDRTGWKTLICLIQKRYIIEYRRCNEYAYALRHI